MRQFSAAYFSDSASNSAALYDCRGARARLCVATQTA